MVEWQVTEHPWASPPTQILQFGVEPFARFWGKSHFVAIGKGMGKRKKGGKKILQIGVSPFVAFWAVSLLCERAWIGERERRKRRRN